MKFPPSISLSAGISEVSCPNEIPNGEEIMVGIKKKKFRNSLPHHENLFSGNSWLKTAKFSKAAKKIAVFNL